MYFNKARRETYENINLLIQFIVLLIKLWWSSYWKKLIEKKTNKPKVQLGFLRLDKFHILPNHKRVYVPFREFSMPTSITKLSFHTTVYLAWPHFFSSEWNRVSVSTTHFLRNGERNLNLHWCWRIRYVLVELCWCFFLQVNETT